MRANRRILHVSAFFSEKIRRCKTISKENLINEEIRDKEVRVIDTDGTMLGIMPTPKALDLANEKKLDFVNISPNATPQKRMKMKRLHIFLTALVIAITAITSAV